MNKALEILNLTVTIPADTPAEEKSSRVEAVRTMLATQPQRNDAVIEAMDTVGTRTHQEALYRVNVVSTLDGYEFIDAMALVAETEENAIEQAVELASRDTLEPAGDNRWLDCNGEILLEAKVISRIPA